MKRTALLTALIFLVIGSMTLGLTAKAPAGKIKIELSGVKGTMFDHTAHEKAAADCQACHHKDAAGQEQGCTTCHSKDGKDGATPGKKMFHAWCTKCHKEKKAANAPVYPKDCKVCHAK